MSANPARQSRFGFSVGRRTRSVRRSSRPSRLARRLLLRGRGRWRRRTTPAGRLTGRGQGEAGGWPRPGKGVRLRQRPLEGGGERRGARGGGGARGGAAAAPGGGP